MASSQVHDCTAVALETINFCHLPAHRIDSFAANAPYFYQILLQRSCKQFNYQLQKMMLNRRPAEDRVASFILQISERLKIRGYSELDFRLSMSREEIGNHLGIAHETVSRILNHFQSLAIIEIRSKQLKILDKKKLLDLYGD